MKDLKNTTAKGPLPFSKMIAGSQYLGGSKVKNLKVSDFAQGKGWMWKVRRKEDAMQNRWPVGCYAVLFPWTEPGGPGRS